MSVPPLVVGMRAAFVFMTRIPLGGFPYRPADWTWAPAHFPLVGLVVGALGGAVYWAFAPLGTWIAAAAAVLATLYVTGAFHEDGLADTADALGGAHSHKKIHDILKDSRIGTYGASALVFSLLLRIGMLAALGEKSRLQTAMLLVCVHALARVGPVVLMAALPYVAGEGAKGSSVAKGGSWSRAGIAMIWGAVTYVLAYQLGFGPKLLASWFAALVVVTGLMGRKFYVRTGGYTGDFLGATEQILELSLLTCTLFWLRFEGWSAWLAV